MPFEFPRQWSCSCAKLLDGLNRNDVEYLVIGSLAKALRDQNNRQPNDTDLMIGRSVENVNRVQQAIVRAYPQHDNNSSRKEFARLKEPGKKQLELPGGATRHEVDILTPPEEFDFEAARIRSETKIVPRYDILVPIASEEDLERLNTLRKDAEASEEKAR